MLGQTYLCKIRTRNGMFSIDISRWTPLVAEIKQHAQRRCNMKTHSIVIGIITVMLTLSVVGGTGDPTSAWTSSNTFTRRFDQGHWKTCFVDPDHPPAVELIFLIWSAGHLHVGCDFHNLGAQIAKIEGREIANEVVGAKYFYPYATLEASNHKESGWIAIGTSPFPLEGKEVAIFAPPNPPNQSVVAYNGSFEINLDAFRKVVGKFEYGRVVLKDGGGTSQVIVLTDLLPPDKSESNND